MQPHLTHRTSFTPKPHQKTAIQAIETELLQADRALACGACGCGKSLIAKEVITRQKASGVAVLFAPSKALLWQASKHWNTPGWKKTFVCSEGEGTTDPNELRRALETKERHVVFSTYQSVYALMKALVLANKTPTIAVMDEAHVTALEGGRFFATTVNEFPAEKKLFMTASPRHYILGNRDRGAELAYSMDNPELYGKKVFNLPLRDAIEKKIVSDYRIVVATEKKETAKGQITDAIILQKAFERYRLKKVITFHGSVCDADCFAKNWAKVNQKIPAFHISGEMSKEEREKAIQGYETADRAILTSAKALIQGIDLPETDGVALLCRKRSKTEITQIIGRALRLHPGKIKGTILLPLLTKHKQSIADAIEEQNLEDLWEVLQSLLEQNEPEHLLDEIPTLTRSVTDKIEFLSEEPIPEEKIKILSKEAKENIRLKWVRNLRTNWEVQFEKLKAIREKTGYADIKDIPTLAGAPGQTRLKIWIEAQRNSEVPPHRRNLLNDPKLGFQWSNFEGQFPFVAGALLQIPGGAQLLKRKDCEPDNKLPAAAQDHRALCKVYHTLITQKKTEEADRIRTTFFEVGQASQPATKEPPTEIRTTFFGWQEVVEANQPPETPIPAKECPPEKLEMLINVLNAQSGINPIAGAKTYRSMLKEVEHMINMSNNKPTGGIRTGVLENYKKNEELQTAVAAHLAKAKERTEKAADGTKEKPEKLRSPQEEKKTAEAIVAYFLAASGKKRITKLVNGKEENDPASFRKAAEKCRKYIDHKHGGLLNTAPEGKTSPWERFKNFPSVKEAAKTHRLHMANKNSPK